MARGGGGKGGAGGLQQLIPIRGTYRGEGQREERGTPKCLYGKERALMLRGEGLKAV